MRINESGGIDRRERLAPMLGPNADAKNHLLALDATVGDKSPLNDRIDAGGGRRRR
jgi:hypothetical protein